MNLRKLFLYFLLSFLSFQICFGQDSEAYPEPVNWLMEYKFYPPRPVYLRYDHYSKEDIVNFREKLNLLKNAKFSNEWEGIYDRGVGGDTGAASFRWDSVAGFVDVYIYTCDPAELRYINYGKALNKPEYILITPEFAMDSPRKSAPEKYVKINWNDRHYLVEESSLAAFAEKIVGIDVVPEDNSDENSLKWANYWVKGDTSKELTGLPEFPAGYKKFQRFPIETKVVSVGNRTIESDVRTARSYANETAIYQVTVDGGARKGIKKGMVFKVPETDDFILITQVEENYALGILDRDIDENKDDYCQDDNSNQIACPKIKPSFKIKTVVGEF